MKNRDNHSNILFEFAPDAYCLVDVKGNFVDGNIAAQKMLGYDKNELIGKNFLKLKLLSIAQLPKAAKLLAKSSLRQPTGPDEFELYRKDGSPIIVEILTQPVKIKNQILVLGTARDITSRKQTEDALYESEKQFRSLFNKLTIGV